MYQYLLIVPATYTTNYISPYDVRVWVVKEDTGSGGERVGALGEVAISNPKKSNLTKGPYIDSLEPNGKTFGCSDTNAQGGDTLVGAKEIFTVGAMACRRAYISNINSTLTQNTFFLGKISDHSFV